MYWMRLSVLPNMLQLHIAAKAAEIANKSWQKSSHIVTPKSGDKIYENRTQYRDHGSASDNHVHAESECQPVQ
jgi:hypothetical protein